MVESMGIFSGIKRRKVEKAFQLAQARHAVAFAEWQKVDNQLAEMIVVVRDCIEGRTHEQFTDKSDYGFMLDTDEFPVAYLQGAAYLELDTSDGPEAINVSDEGHAMITNQRILFSGSARTHEWELRKLINMTHVAMGYTVFATKGRGKPAGLGYGEGPALDVQFRLEIAAAMARDTLPKYLDELTAQKQKHSSEAPVPPPPIG
jgi:hypothetical protein